MKTLSIILSLLASILFSKAQSFELSAPNFPDTINLINADGKKQGKWIIWGSSKHGSCYEPRQVIEEGLYKDNKRVGTWVEYHCNGNLKMKTPYINGRPHGHVLFYFGNGEVREEGNWVNNRWTGSYKSVNDKGDITEIVFDAAGNEISKKITLAKAETPSK
jgi:antitoxin component YwqK of YwqJK toxin-antitoxin module